MKNDSLNQQITFPVNKSILKFKKNQIQSNKLPNHMGRSHKILFKSQTSAIQCCKTSIIIIDVFDWSYPERSAFEDDDFCFISTVSWKKESTIE